MRRRQSRKQNFKLEVSLADCRHPGADGFVRTPGIQLLSANATLMDALVRPAGR